MLTNDVSGMCCISPDPVTFSDHTDLSLYSEFVPYAFQLCAQLLELHPVTELTPQYQALMAPLLHASLWNSRGNVPALVRLWKSIIQRGAGIVVANGHLPGLLGIFQKLVGSKLTDIYGFDLISTVYEFVPK